MKRRQIVSLFTLVAFLGMSLPATVFAQEAPPTVHQDIQIDVQPANPTVVVNPSKVTLRPKFVVPAPNIHVDAPVINIPETVVNLPEMRPVFAPNIVLPTETPIYKRWELWTGVGAGVAILAVVIGCAAGGVFDGGSHTDMNVGRGR